MGVTVKRSLLRRAIYTRGGKTSSHVNLQTFACRSLGFLKNYIVVYILIYIAKCRNNVNWYSIIFASHSKMYYVVTKALIVNKFVFLDLYVAALCNFAFMMCGSYIEHIWPSLIHTF